MIGVIFYPQSSQLILSSYKNHLSRSYLVRPLPNILVDSSRMSSDSVCLDSPIYGSFECLPDNAEHSQGAPYPSSTAIDRPDTGNNYGLTGINFIRSCNQLTSPRTLQPLWNWPHLQMLVSAHQPSKVDVAQHLCQLNRLEVTSFSTLPSIQLLRSNPTSPRRIPRTRQTVEQPLYNNQVSAWFLSESRPTLSLGSAVRRRRSCFPLPFANYVIDGYESAHRTVF